MLIEITGCSGSGKTTFARILLERLGHCECKVRHNVSFSESPVRQMLENLYWDIVALNALHLSKTKYEPFLDLAAHTLSSFNASLFSRMNIMRSIKRKVGAYQKLRNNYNNNVVSVMDEGPVHAAHVLFAHPLNPNNRKDYRSFSACVPVPDVLVYVRSDIKRSVQRTMVRRDPPWGFRSVDEVEGFINNAHKMFENLLFEFGLHRRTRLVIVDDISNEGSLEEIMAYVGKGNE